MVFCGCFVGSELVLFGSFCGLWCSAGCYLLWGLVFYGLRYSMFFSVVCDIMLAMVFNGICSLDCAGSCGLWLCGPISLSFFRFFYRLWRTVEDDDLRPVVFSILQMLCCRWCSES